MEICPARIVYKVVTHYHRLNLCSVLLQPQTTDDLLSEVPLLRWTYNSHHLWFILHEIMQRLRSCDKKVNKHPKAKKAGGSKYKHHLDNKQTTGTLTLRQTPKSGTSTASWNSSSCEYCTSFQTLSSLWILFSLPRCLGPITPCQVLGNDIFTQ